MKTTKKRKIKTNSHLKTHYPLFWHILLDEQYKGLLYECCITQHARDIEYQELLAYRTQQGINWPQ